MRKTRKLTITAAEKALANKGHRLVGFAGYGPKWETRYTVEIAGQPQILTAEQIAELIQN